MAGSFGSSQWRWVTMADIAEERHGLVDGPFGSSLPASDYVAYGVPVIRGSNLTLGEGKFVSKEFVYVSDSTARRLERSLCKPDDIIFTKKGTLGQTGFVPRNGTHGQYLLSSNQMKLSVNRAVADPLFIYYYVSSSVSREKIIRDSEATGVPKINLAYLRTFPVPLPPLPEQRAIASILGSLDDKIELNRQMNATLEAIAQALFKSWFVDFDPVRAKAEGREPVGMDAETAALFPDGFEGSALGEIPKGWSLSTLNALTEYVVGGDWGSDSPNIEATEPAFCIRGADIPDLQNAGLGKMPTRYLKASSLQKRSLRSGDIVVEVSGGSPTQSTGRAVLVTDDLLDHLPSALVCSNFCRMVRLSQGSSSLYVYFWLRWLYSWDALLPYENGTTGIKNFAYSIFSKQHELLLPPPPLLKRFDALVSPLIRQQKANGIQSRTLATLRDTLLPKLLSGEVRVAEAISLV